MNLPDPMPETHDLKLKVVYNQFNRLREYCKSITPQFGGGGKLHRTPDGFTITPTPPQPGVALIPCVVEDQADSNGMVTDVVSVWKFDFETISSVGDPFYVAKSLSARSPDSESIDGNTISYFYWPSSDYPSININQRAAIWPDSTVTYQTINERYDAWLPSFNGDASLELKQYLLYIMPAETGVMDGNGNPTHYLEVAPFRRWVASAALNYAL